MKTYRFASALAVGAALMLPCTTASAQRIYVNAQPGYYGGGGYGGGYGYYEPVRLRLALGATAGGFIGDTIDNGFLFGLWGQLGVQFNRLIAVYYQAHLMLGGYVQPGQTVVGGFSYNEAMIDFTIQDVFQIGIGPSFDVISACDNTNACTQSWYGGADLRIGFAIGARRRFQRAGFMLGVDIHPTFIPTTDAGGNDALGVATSVLLTIGGGFY